MEHKLSINQKMLITVSLIALMFMLLLFFFSMTLNQSKEIGITRSSEVMYQDQKDKVLVATHSMALSLGEILKTVPDHDERIALIQNAVDPIRFEEDKSGYFFVYEKTTALALPSKKELVGTDMGESQDIKGIYYVQELKNQATNGGGFVDYIFTKPEAGDQPKIGYAEMIPGTEYWIGTGVYLDNIAATKAEISDQIGTAVRKRNLIMYLIVVPLFVLILGALLYITQSIVKPLARVSGNLRSAADQVASASGSVSQSGQLLAEGSTQQAASIQETSASLTQLASQTRQNSQNATHADKLMKDATRIVDSANLEMERLTASMTDISESSDEIHKIVQSINDIAFQTNLLALNAAVEAARAGKAGEGFAVVASEVRNLAVRAADSAHSTAQLITNTSERIKEGEVSAQRTKEAFMHIQNSSTKVAHIVTEISAASQDQSEGIDQINLAVNEMNEVVQKNTATAEEAASSSEEMAAQAKEMELMSFELSHVVNGSSNPNTSNEKVTSPMNIKAFFQNKKKLALPSLFLALILTSAVAQAQNLNFSGFVSTESYFDNKEAVAAREADVLLYPQRPRYDNLNNDLTDDRTFHMVSFNSRLKMAATEIEAFGAKSTGVIEIDFLGTGEGYVNMIRMRHAYIKLNWEKSSLLMGQYWHPMFVTSSYPEVLGWGGAAPINVLSRNPQVRFTYQVQPNLSASVTALSHRDFTSNGPNGYSSEYIRNSGVPEFNLQVIYSKAALTSGFTMGTKSIKPSGISPSGNELEETLQSWHTNAFVKLATKKVNAKLVGIYGQNLTNFLMIGGYAEQSVSPDLITFTNLKTSSVWSEISSTGEKARVALFAGFSKNHGADGEVAHVNNDIIANFYGRGTDIDRILRIAPRLTFNSGPLLWGLEYTWTSAGYGTPDVQGKVIDVKNVTMYRLQLAAKYTF